MTVDHKPQRTFSDSPWYWDGSADSLLEPEQNVVQGHYKQRVAYYHPKDVGNYHYGVSMNDDTGKLEEHPMRPHRLELTNQLVMGYGLHKHMSVHSPRPATQDELGDYHAQDYLEFLKRATPASKGNQHLENVMKYSPSDDCPIFDNMFSFCQQYAGASLAAARKLGNDATDIAINWSGGLHHAKKSQASGFCYVNDIVLAILQLLRTHPRVLYIDIDAHHGDGVQEAFWRSNRVMTVSFHKYGEGFFPFTGRLDERGDGTGKYFALNVPLRSGIRDHNYLRLFKAIMEPTIMKFRPTAIVLQCGADSLGGDRLGPFNLSIKAHGECVRYIKNYGLPLLVLGGGGYRQSSVARCWAYETGILTGKNLPNELPQNSYYEYYGPEYQLHPDLTAENHHVPDDNTPARVERIRILIMEKLRYLDGAPSVQMQEIPPDLMGLKEDEDRTVDERLEEEYGALSGEYRKDSKVRDGDLLPEEGARPGKTSRRY